MPRTGFAVARRRPLVCDGYTEIWHSPDGSMQGQRSARIHGLLNKGPTVGDLLALCEENYQHLHSLVPQLKRLQGKHCSSRPDHQDLHLTIVEQTPYTTLLRLTYEFPLAEGGLSDPNVLLRVYHDARQVEVEDLRQQNLPVRKLYEAPGLINKWRLNLFVSKWLVFCVGQGHMFVDDISALRQPACDLSR